MSKRTTISSALLLALPFTNCVEVKYRNNPDFCTEARGNETCAEHYPDGSRPYCVVSECLDDFHGCFPYEPVEECASPCGLENPDCVAGSTTTSSGTESGSGSSSEESGSGSGSESSSTTGPMTCTSDEECTDAGAPFCGVTGECGTCEGMADPDGACAGVDPLHPLCVDGACVACTPENPVVCDEQLLLCDGDTNACSPCTAHEQCGSGACELAVGTCFPPDTVVHVDGDGGQDFLTVAAAVMSIGVGLHGVIVVHELDGGENYQGTTVVDAGKVIAIVAAPGEVPSIQGTGGNPSLRVQGAGTILYVDGLRVAGNTMGLGLHVNDARAWVDRSRIVQNTGGGVLAENGAELTLRNCFIGGPIDGDAVIIDGASLSQTYTTIGAGPVAVGRTRALFCQNELAVDVQNSILLSLDDDPEIECSGTVPTDSATEADVGFNAAWFTNYVNGDFTLSASGAMTFANVAQWQAGDPLTDIDGDPRPTVDGTLDYAGADVP